MLSPAAAGSITVRIVGHHQLGLLSPGKNISYHGRCSKHSRHYCSHEGGTHVTLSPMPFTPRLLTAQEMFMHQSLHHITEAERDLHAHTHEPCMTDVLTR